MNKESFWERDYYKVACGDMAEYEKDWKIKKSIDYLFEKLKDGQKVLEVGCGLAGLGDILKRDVFYTGVDVSKYALDIARERLKLKRNIRFLEASADSLPLENGEFDFVLSFFSLEHFNKPREALLEMIRVLKPGGYLVITAPNLEFPFCYPSALRHKNKSFKFKFYLMRLYDYIMRAFGSYSFRVLSENYLQATGRYEKKDDDLVYLASSFEVINFLKKRNFEFIFINKFKISGNSVKEKIRKIITRFPLMRYYGVELFFIAKKL